MNQFEGEIRLAVRRLVGQMFVNYLINPTNEDHTRRNEASEGTGEDGSGRKIA